MRAARWTLAALAAVALVGVVVTSSSPDVDAQEDPAVAAKVAKEELAKAIARGKELWESKDIGRKACKQCHEDPDKPEDVLADRKWSYPAYSRRARRVVTLQQKINEMIKYKARGKELDTGGADIAAIAAYVSSIRK